VLLALPAGLRSRPAFHIVASRKPCLEPEPLLVLSSSAKCTPSQLVWHPSLCFSESITCNWTWVSVNCQLRDFERMIVVAQALNITVSTTSWSCEFAIQGRGWGDVLRLLWNVFRPTGTILTKNILFLFSSLEWGNKLSKTLFLLLSEGMLYCSFAFLCIFGVHILFDSCHFVFYICHKWHTSFFACWTLFISCPRYYFIVFWYSRG